MELNLKQTFTGHKMNVCFKFHSIEGAGEIPPHNTVNRHTGSTNYLLINYYYSYVTSSYSSLRTQTSVCQLIMFMVTKFIILSSLAHINY